MRLATRVTGRLGVSASTVPRCRICQCQNRQNRQFDRHRSPFLHSRKASTSAQQQRINAAHTSESGETIELHGEKDKPFPTRDTPSGPSTRSRPTTPSSSSTSLPAEWRKTLENHFRRLTRESEKKLTEVGLRVNQVTGYDEVERLKDVVARSETHLTSSRRAARAAKLAYDQAVQSRSNAQHEVNSLLERKHSWTDSDVSQFTSLVRQDHSSSLTVNSTSADLRDKEQEVDLAFSDLTKAILQRYHEEQVWSDKIRNVSTWVNIAGLLVNFVVFVGAIAIVEPWKRRRLVERVEERMVTMVGKVEEEIRGLREGLVASGVDALVLTEEMDSDLAEVELSPPTGSPMSLGPLDPIFSSTWWKVMDDFVAPTPERDLAVAGGICVAVGAVTASLISAVFR